MKPNEILNQCFEGINNRTKKVVYPVTKYCDTGSVLPGRKGDSFGCDVKLYEHKSFRTRLYRDAGCAAYKLIRFLEIATLEAEEIYWRVKPDILQHRDFNTQYPQYKGCVRLSVFGKNGEYISMEKRRERNF